MVEEPDDPGSLLPAEFELRPGDAKDPWWVPELLEALASGVSLYEWTGRGCTKEHRNGRPLAWTVRLWLMRSVSGRERFNAARAAGAELLVEKMNNAAEGPGDDADTMVRVGRDRLRMDQARWLAGVWNPEYAPKQRVEQNGNVKVTVVTGVPDVPRGTLENGPSKPRITMVPDDEVSETP